MCGLFIFDFTYLQFFMEPSHILIYSHCWSFYMQIFYIYEPYFSVPLSHIIMSTCIQIGLGRFNCVLKPISWCSKYFIYFDKKKNYNILILFTIWIESITPKLSFSEAIFLVRLEMSWQQARFWLGTSFLIIVPNTLYTIKNKLVPRVTKNMASIL